MDIDALNDSEFLRPWQLVKIAGHNDKPIFPFSAPTLYRMISNGDFPKPMHLGKRLTAWKASEIRAWIDSKTTAESK